MSANLLMNPLQRVMIEDELESFFHILIYYAVRYLESNLATDEHAAHFLEACFDCFTVHGKNVICGSQKLLVVQDGETPEILFNHPMYMNKNLSRPITFGSDALNGLIATMIPCLRAHYKVLTWNNWLKTLPEDHPFHPHRRTRYETPPPPSGSRSDAEDAVRGAAFPRDDSGTVSTEQGGKPQELLAAPPTKEDLKDAMNLASHKYIREQFQTALDDGLWKDNDKVGDRVPSDYSCHFPVHSSIQLTVKSNVKMLPAVSSE